ncbi:reverse transcriptase [Plakobranchus ocellatus]|uniref:Reverse transcriptase n=1 Tax=Plakobranchus ocellatus TaxID=259542 RepID=A0AAV3ZAP8_9GAST|nr:reverse transcriptase [Plakobranchus ocellatus]
MVAEALVGTNSRFGVLEKLSSEKGIWFISDCMKEVCRLLGIKQMATTPYKPMCNGIVERFKATPKTCLCCMYNDRPRRLLHQPSHIHFILPRFRCSRENYMRPHSYLEKALSLYQKNTLVTGWKGKGSSVWLTELILPPSKSN